MIVETGHFALILALMVALFQATVPLWGAQRGDGALMAASRSAAALQFALVAIAFAALTYAHATSDFSVLNVVNNSHSDKPMLYKISGVWGNHEGSMLLWVLILALYGIAVAVFGRNLPPALRARVLAIQALIAVGFYLFILFTSNPFVRIFPAPANGQGLNPLLQDPGLAFHPPFLYLGYVGFSIAFSFAIAALIEGRVDAAWARWVRPWTLAAWTFLTVGIGLGSWWAYYELGWGGWWFWDPVENASFMPWLVGTALLHSSIVVEKRNALKGWTIFLSILAFSFSLLGTFIVRSGVLTSVHSFATDPRRGVFILVLLIIVIGGSFTLFALRGPQLKAGGLFRPISREGSLLLNNLGMTTAAAAVLLGTLYPLFLDAIGGDKVSVGPPFFNAVFIPLMMPVLIVMAVGPFMAWKRGDLKSALTRLRIALFGAAAVSLIGWYIHSSQTIFAALGMGVAAWLIIATLSDGAVRIKLFKTSLGESLRRLAHLPRANWGMWIAHIGLGVAMVGMIGSTIWRTESIQVMKIGQTVHVSGFDYTFKGVREGRGPNYFSTTGTLDVSRNGKAVTVMHPQNRIYPVQHRPTTEAAIYPTVWRDLYVALGDKDAGGGYVVRIYDNPLVTWIWGGVLLLMLGGLVSLTDRRHRIGAPTKSRTKAPSGAAGAPAE
ncbi:heme lyase CcmF/NrfE family subunit [Varunaivibrio sulfuroxidans]|uniref:Cytochrome c-type biogenesis protein CcmF n=1 Tax=Varunaivibrio sulfuroxidans TaxID=1773489 RepID=A0A4R3JEU5_9PROT|nr:heme lyase CcmF/NrfE family subunit [Varunaivibrio sulfuroxidans]TCS63646.1 cytochrome c-type biogenesis protein CcmF [Varunaivibrio sulfuroxidans]WES30215.1 heme lyase CcmF/NrfE family subunit [Varunaivibrio sulfuroxidans]